MNSIGILRCKCPLPVVTVVRNKSINHWHKLRTHTFPRELAMQHFDNFYGKVYDMNWKSARLGLMCQNKYAAIVNNFGDNEETESMLTGLGAIELSNYYRRHHKKHLRYKLRMKIVKEKKEKKRAMMAQEQNVDPGSINLDDVVVSDVSDDEIRRQANEANLTGLSGSEAEDIVEMFQTDIENQSNNRQFINPANTRLNLNDFIPATELIFHEEIVTDKPYFEFYQADSPLENVDIIKEDIIEFPETLRVYTYPRRNLSDFPHPTVSKGLNVFNYYVMDGGSVLPVLALGIKPRDIVGDFCAAPGGKSMLMLQTLRPSKLVLNENSISRMARLKNVIKSYVPEMEPLRNLIEIRDNDAKTMCDYETFDKILLDVPCTNDRHSVNVDDNNYFKSSRVKERIALPKEQCDILINGIKCLKPGGTLVYSTCSLSPIQNDGVVHMAIKQLTEHTPIKVSIIDMKEALRPLRGLFRFYRDNKYGQQVMPFLPSNFGPIYFCKIKREV